MWALFCVGIFFFVSSYRLLILGTDGFDTVWVPDDNVSIGTDGNPTFTRIQVEDFGGVGGCDCHKLVFVHLAHGLTGREIHGEGKHHTAYGDDAFRDDRPHTPQLCPTRSPSAPQSRWFPLGSG